MLINSVRDYTWSALDKVLVKLEEVINTKSGAGNSADEMVLVEPDPVRV